MLAQLVRSDAIERPVALDWDFPGAICVNRMAPSFAEETEAILGEILDELTPLN